MHFIPLSFMVLI